MPRFFHETGNIMRGIAETNLNDYAVIFSSHELDIIPVEDSVPWYHE